MKSHTPCARRKVRYAVVGLGHISQVAVLPSFVRTNNSELAALVSSDDAKLDALRKRYHGVQVYTYDEFDRCLADPSIDAIYIALPNDLHLEYTLRAAAAGKHILCEKPLAPSLQHSRRMIAAARRNRVLLMTAYRLHFEPTTLATLALLRSGRLGEARYFTASFSFQIDPGNVRLKRKHAGGPLFDIGVYCLNAARQFIGAEPIEVSAFTARTGDKRFSEVEETASVLLRFPEGRLASFTVSFGATDVSRCQWVGTRGHLVLEPAFDYSKRLRQIVTLAGKSKVKIYARTDQFAGEIERFSDCIRKRRQPEASGEEGLADLRVIDAIFRSAATGRSVRLMPFTRHQRPSLRQVARKPPAARKPRPAIKAHEPRD